MKKVPARNDSLPASQGVRLPGTLMKTSLSPTCPTLALASLLTIVIAGTARMDAPYPVLKTTQAMGTGGVDCV